METSRGKWKWIEEPCTTTKEEILVEPNQMTIRSSSNEVFNEMLVLTLEFYSCANLDDRKYTSY